MLSVVLASVSCGRALVYVFGLGAAPAGARGDVYVRWGSKILRTTDDSKDKAVFTLHNY